MTTSSRPPIGEPVLDASKKELILRLAAEGLSRRSIARIVGCAPSTITRTAKRDPEFGADLALAEESLKRNALQTLNRVVLQDKYWRAAAWIAERLEPERFARRRPEPLSTDEADDFDEERAIEAEPAAPAEAAATSRVTEPCATTPSQENSPPPPPASTVEKPPVQHTPRTYYVPPPSPLAGSPLMEAASVFFNRPDGATDILGRCTDDPVRRSDSWSGVGLMTRPKAKKRRRK